MRTLREETLSPGEKRCGGNGPWTEATVGLQKSKQSDGNGRGELKDVK